MNSFISPNGFNWRPHFSLTCNMNATRPSIMNEQQPTANNARRLHVHECSFCVFFFGIYSRYYINCPYLYLLLATEMDYRVQTCHVDVRLDYFSCSSIQRVKQGVVCVIGICECYQSTSTELRKYKLIISFLVK